MQGAKEWNMQLLGIRDCPRAKDKLAGMDAPYGKTDRQKHAAKEKSGTE